MVYPVTSAARTEGPKSLAGQSRAAVLGGEALQFKDSEFDAVAASNAMQAMADVAEQHVREAGAPPAEFIREAIDALAVARRWLARQKSPFEPFGSEAMVHAQSDPIPIEALRDALMSTAIELTLVHKWVELRGYSGR
jgi:hypothetical protein